jgi:hypothetical protein
MIAVFVRHQNRVELFRFDIKSLQTGLGLAQGKTTVDQNAGLTVFD